MSGAPGGRRLRSRARRAARAIRSPADGLLAARMVAWAAVLPVAKRAVPLETLARRMWRGHAGTRDRAREARVIALSRMLHRGIAAGRRDNCLERSLVAYRYLSAAGADPELVVGVRRAAAAVEGHVWVLLDGEPVHDEPADVAPYEVIASFGARGRRPDAGA